MKKLPLGALVGAAMLGSGSPALGQVDVNHDGIQTVFSIGPESGRPFEVSAAYACPGEQACRPAVVRVVFGAYNRKLPKYDDNHAVSVIIDGEGPLSLPDPAHSARRAPANQVYESIVCMIGVDEYLALANGKKVEYVIGPSKGELSDKQLKALAALAEKIPAAEEPPAEAEEPGGSSSD